MDLKNLFSFKGRQGRKEFWKIYVCLVFSVILIRGLLTQDSPVAFVLGLALLSAYLWVILATVVKRLRDTGYPVWIAPIVFIPLIGISIIVICGFFKSENQECQIIT